MLGMGKECQQPTFAAGEGAQQLTHHADSSTLRTANDPERYRR
jgi:hypothetical protein